MVATVLQGAALPAVAADDGKGRPDLPRVEKPVPGTIAKVKPRTLMKGPRTPKAAPRAAWPKAASAVVKLPTAGAKAGASPVQAQGLPLALTADAERATGRAYSQVTVGVLGRKTAQKVGVDGVLFTLEPKASNENAKATGSGWVRARVDYSSFAGAYGGAYASRLTLVELPACALTTPDRQRCRIAKRVEAVNDTEKQTLTASELALHSGEPTVLAAVAAEDGAKGDYKATSLSPSAAWNTNLNTGDFTWSYGMSVPDVPGGLTPTVGLSYSSGGVDGRTANTNNQSSWVGDGFDLWPGFIERRYKPCADDGVENADGGKPGDLCWAYDNAFMSFNGKGGELVPNGTDSWKLKSDDGTKIDRLFGSDTNVRGNDARNDEYWRVTTPEGIRYYFGYNRLPGWADGKETTDSTWTVPVFGNGSGEPCHGATFADSWCRQAWRWNLDYVVDPHGNALAYYYDKETNSYGRNLKAKDNTPYVRGGELDRIEYGLKSSSMYGTKALAKVDFTSSERCIPDTPTDCASIDKDAFYWYDTPWDLNCTADEDCDEGRLSPAFFTRKRLTSITTQVYDGSTYRSVDSWKMEHRWGKADTDYQLELESIQRTGHTADPAITLPKTTFTYTQLANRLDKTGDGYAPFIKDRLSTVADESGGQIDIKYSPEACKWDALPTPQTNTTRCFPQYIGGSTSDDPERQWFNKYVVAFVTTTDRTGGAPDQVTAYDYKGGAAWHFDDDDGLTKEKFKTWSQWRGYGQVQVQTGGQGGTAAMKSQQDTYFLRGMDGDRKDSSGGTKSVTVTLEDGEGDPITDHQSAAGFAYKTVSYSGPDGKVLAKTVNRPWHHETAKKVRDWGTVTANFTGTAHTKTFTSLDDGAGAKWRTVSGATSYDTVAGRVTEVDDFGDNDTAADNRCTRTTYATNTDKNILTLPSRVEAVAKACDAAVSRPENVISDARTAYDGGAYDAAPTAGDPTGTAVLKKYDGTTAAYTESGSTYDAYGRVLTSSDLTADVTATAAGVLKRTTRSDGRTTTTAYTPEKGIPTSAKVTSPPAKPGDASTTQTTTTTRDVLRGLPLTETDTNGKVTNYAYDALGRSTKVWLADRLTGQTPTYEFTYTVTDDQPVAVGTKTLGNRGVQSTSYTLYDGLLRERQTQAPGPGGGRLLTDVFYDERGLKAKDFATYYTDGKPTTTLFKPADALNVQTQNRYTYDGLGRQTEARQIAGNGDGGTVLGVTKTIYGGDRTTVIPPVGGTATTTLTDARGQTTELRQHHQRTTDAAYDTTAYTYTPRSELKKVTDPAKNTWTYTYDLLGQLTTATDPDKGTTKNTYDDRGQLTFSTDARDTTLAYVYDGLGRRTELHEDIPSGELRAKWVYDTITGAKGHLAESTRYEGSDAYTSKVVAYDNLYRPQRSSITIPAAEGALQGTYLSVTTYAVSGLVEGIGYPKAGALPAATVSYTYEDETLRPIAIGGSQGVKSAVIYSLTGKPLQYDLSSSGSKTTQVSNTYEWGTQRLATSRVERQDIAGVDQYSTYRYDEVGNVLSVSDVSRSGTDNQCFTYDYLQRLTEAWTQGNTSCAANPSGGVLGGPASYWHSYTYDQVGNRRTETLHDPTGNTSKDTKRTYGYPEPGSAQPHTLTSVKATGPNGTSQDTFGYDKAGNTTTRTLGGDTQSLAWDAEGHLAKVTEPVEGGSDKVTEYLYDADGNRLIGRTPTETTLYLGNTEITLPKGSTTPKATRYIDLGDGHQAVQEDDGTVSLTLADHHGTAQLAIDATTQKLAQRRTLPFGDLRGDQPTDWPGTKGFVGGTDNTKTTGLTHLGARDYDPTTGRFLSVDPVMDLTDPQQVNGYTYANNNPVTGSDPTGRFCDGCSADGANNNWTPSHGPGCTTEGCYDTSGRILYPTSNTPSRARHSSGGNANGPGRAINVTQKKGELWIEGIRVPSARELQARFPQYDSDEQLQTWAKQTCYSPSSKPQGFCSAAEAIGLVDYEQNAFEKTVTAIAVSLVKPDIGAWKQCLSGKSTSACGAASLDLPWARVFKGLKVLKACHSFIPGTKVLMADGTAKPIEDVKIGDKILATDPKTGKTTTKTVTAEIKGEGLKHLVKITLDLDGKRGNKTASVTATDSHPFWVPELNEWIDAKDLQPGQWIRTSAGTRIQITALKHWTQQAKVHNLTITDLHTYYVLAGSTPVLVHNSGPCPTARFVTDANGVTIDLKPLGRGSTGRTAPNSLNEQLAMETVMANPMAGRVIPLKKGMTDPRWMGSDGWVKMTRRVNMGAEGDVEIHYVMNTITGHVDDYKFK
ncbi:polymorphic toxin-type HINT domain-containing protein [Streptomyces sp. NBS 14/10]|uniref:polymorphic toxin-type HINT domain-containing protein n=1 Tax=Streptomyces sp. NBS 14/10 TaxID=1945643 RepID=UPI000B7FF5DB|nr:polymorphic toxin-type HINT domain-containing protein [Streptomyces sp. NBS 14/10]KAK1183177.1 polymorphic toxin-type HINT domain-containing protein [Streptomyces sp. NBS 14/10]